MHSSSSSSSSLCEAAPLAPGPLEALALAASSTRIRRSRRVLYPAFRNRRPSLKEASDPARRWLLLLSVLVLLQIYTEETHTCTDLQNQNQCPELSQPQEGGESRAEAHGFTMEETYWYQTADRPPEHQMECVVA